MRVSWLLPIGSVLLLAQTMPPPLLRGVLLERDPQTDSGEFSVRDTNSQVFRFLFDAKTYVERDRQSINVARLQPGENVEVVSDEVSGSLLRYARTIHVLPQPVPPSRTLSQGRTRPYRNNADRLLATDREHYGAVAFSGVVFRVSPERVVLHTREGDQTFLLRPDTRYLEDGGAVGLVELKPNMRVFVRAGKTLYNELEAYQVIWGNILEPH
jgi:hypothetical protein